MQEAPPRNPFAVLACVMLAFCAGPALGMAAARASAPHSELAQIVSPLAFALAFAGGLLLWFGMGAVAIVGAALRRWLRGGWRRARPPAGTPLPPGYGAFLWLSLALGLAAGVVAGLAPQAISFWGACALHVAAGVGYGALLRALAVRGYLPFPEPS